MLRNTLLFVLCTATVACNVGDTASPNQEATQQAPIFARKQPSSEAAAQPAFAETQNGNHRTPAAADIVPDTIRKFVKPGDVLLAYKTLDLTGDGEKDAVIVVRHPLPKEPFDYSQNPCDLLVLHGESGSYVLSGKSDKAVDCTYINFSKKMAARPDDLNEYIELKPGIIAYVNQKTKSTSIYSFKYSAVKSSWYLSRAENNYSTFDVEKDKTADVQEVIGYPGDFQWIAMSKFDPNMLEVAFKKSRKIDYSSIN